MAIEASSLLKVGRPLHRGRRHAATHRPRVKLAGYIRWVYAGPDDQTAIALLDEGRFALVDLDAGQVLDEGDVGFVPDPSDFSAWAAPGQWRRWRAPRARRRYRRMGRSPRAGHRGGSWQVAYAPDGAIFASGGWDGTIALWDGDTGAPLGRVRPGPHTDAQPEFLSDGHTVVFPRTTGPSTHGIPDPRRGSRLRADRRSQPDTRGVERRLGSRPYRQTCPTSDQS